jgi:hypothetical protein
MLFDGSSHKRDEIGGLRTERQIDLFRQREDARRARVERREAEARVRHLNLDLLIRSVLLVLVVAIGFCVAIGAAGNPHLLELSLVATSGWAAIAIGAARVLRPKARPRSELNTPTSGS